ncbi:MAG: hypothetical protein AAGF35_11090 [Pseudomonadota bacterium]
MITPYVVIAVWILCGGVAWKIATDRGRNSTVWTILGQLLGPFSIVLALFSTKVQQRGHYRDG